MATLTVIRPTDVTFSATIEITKDVIFTNLLMQEHTVKVMNLDVPTALAIQINDYILVNGTRYKVNTVPDVDETHRFVYNLVFEAPEYTLYDFLFFDPTGVTDFTFYGTLEDHIDMLLANANLEDPGWTKGTIEQTNPMFVTYTDYTCRVALSTIAETFKVEYYFNNKQINVVKQAGTLTTHEFEYGMQKGLYSLKRTFVSEENVKTKVYGFGSTRNIPSNYRGGIGRLTFNERFIAKNVNLYGTKQTIFKDDEIYPTRESTITAVSTIDANTQTFVITDPTMDFDINAHLLSGVTAKVAFTSGDLYGEEFEITNYNHATKQITLAAYVNSANIKLPSAAFKPVVGEKYKLLDIGLPNSYIVAAEAKLKASTIAFTDQVSVPRVQYALDMDVLYAKINNITLNPGDIVKIKSQSLGVNDQIRVVGITYPMTYPNDIDQDSKLEVTIANFVPYTVQDRALVQSVHNQTAIRRVNRQSIELARRNTANFRNLQNLIYDPDGYFDAGNIKPGSIETLMLSVGAKSQNFRLLNAVFVVNAGGDPNTLNISDTVLQHYEIEIPTLGYSWALPQRSFTGLDPNKAYYVYAHCSDSALNGTWEISDSPVLVDQDAGYYNFLIGVIYKVTNGYRDRDLVYGTASLVGNNLTIGRVKDITGQNFFDLESGDFNMGVPESGVDWNVSNPGKLTIRGGFVQNSGGVTSLIGVYRGLYNNLTTYYTGDTVTYDGSLWRYINPNPIFNVTPAQNSYWTLQVAKGINGVDGNDGLPGAPGSNSYFHVAYADSADGSVNFNQTGGKYIGTYVDSNQADSPTYSTYNWVLLKGADGSDGTNGIPGINGANGQTSYLHIKYSNDNGLTFTGSNGEAPGQYLGQYVDFTLADSTNPNDYTWALIKGANGTNGTNGLNGQYTEYRFAKNGSTNTPPSIVPNDPVPVGWNTNQPTLDPLEYLWIVSATKSGAGSLLTDWSTPARFTPVDGVNGTNGTNGAQGPFVLGRGVWDVSKTYYGLADRVEVVKYGADWYVTRVDAGAIAPGTLPTNTTYYNPFGGQFESVATDLLFASLAYIKNLGVQNLKTANSGKRVEVDSIKNSVKIYDANDKLIIDIDDDSAVNSGATYQSYSQIYDENGNPAWLYEIDMGGGVYKYVYPDKDMGIAIGLGINDPNGFTAIGRNEVYTTGRFKAMPASQEYGSVMSEHGFQYTDVYSTSRVKKGINVNVSGSTTENTAAELVGDVKITGGIKMNGATAASWSGDIRLTVGSQTFEFVNGLLMSVHS